MAKRKSAFSFSHMLLTLALNFVAACRHNTASSENMSVGVPAPANAPPSAMGFAVMAVGNVETTLVKRVAHHLESTLWVPTRVFPPPPDLVTGLTPERVKALATHRRFNDVCLVILANAPQTAFPAEFILKEQSLACLNTASLRSGSPTDRPEDPFARRVEKETIRLVATLLGMPPCPMPLCALCTAEDEEHLDAKGRTPCPPCLGKLEDILRARGIKLTVDNPSSVLCKPSGCMQHVTTR